MSIVKEEISTLRETYEELLEKLRLRMVILEETNRWVIIMSNISPERGNFTTEHKIEKLEHAIDDNRMWYLKPVSLTEAVKRVLRLYNTTCALEIS